MDIKLQKELAFWRDIYHQMGDKWLEYRERVSRDIVSKFPEPYLSEMLNCKGTVLEVGTGLVSPMYFFLADNNFDLKAIDPTGAEYYITCGAEDISFKDNLFDYIICMNALDHVDNADKALEEMYRVLMPDGFLLLQVHCNTSIGGPHTYSFNEATLTEIVEKYNFNILYAEAPIKADGIDAIYIVARKEVY